MDVSLGGTQPPTEKLWAFTSGGQVPSLELPTGLTSFGSTWRSVLSGCTRPRGTEASASWEM